MKHKYCLRFSALLVALLLGLCPLSASAITLFHVDDFETETTQGWGGGTGGSGSGPPVIVTSDGPAGAGDAYMRLPGADAYLGSFNNTPNWTGNYTTAGVTYISFDVANFGPEPVDLRILMTGFGMFELHEWVSTMALTVAPTGTWSRQSLEISGAAMTEMNGVSEGFELFSPNKILIRHDPGVASASGDNPGGEVNTFVGLDNITADNVPEPSQGLLLALGGLSMAFAQFRRRR